MANRPQDTRIEAEKLLKQAMASNTTSIARKAEKASELIVEIGKIQSNAQQGGVETKKNFSAEEETQWLAERIFRLEAEQQKTREHIQQLIQTKNKLEEVRRTALATETQQQREYNRKLQDKLARVITEKEKEYRLLMDELTSVRKKAEAQAIRLREERDHARTLAAQKKNKDAENSGPIQRVSHAIPITLLLVAFTVLAGGIIYNIFPNWFMMQSATPETKVVADPNKPLAETPEPVSEAPAKPKKMVLSTFQDALRSGGKGPLMVELAGGEFLMGAKPSMPYSDELPQLTISLQAFSISKHEITFEQYDVFANATNRALPEDNRWGRGARPVVNVSWEDARAYTNWLAGETGKPYRLPSEREWEFAAKAGAETLFWWGNDIGQNQANCASCGSRWDMSQTAPVGSFAPNPYGLLDMIGNVAEWTQTCRFLNYAGAPLQGNLRSGGDCTKHMVRGGSFRTYPNTLRVTRRTAYNAQAKNDDLGFRVALGY